jgi:hypothetical protein
MVLALVLETDCLLLREWGGFAQHQNCQHRALSAVTRSPGASSS